MSRQVFLDTETTGLYAEQGHRIIEIAAVEMINRRLTQRHFHVYLNPQREIDPAAQEVHGITLEFLQDKPLFNQIAEEFIAFVRDTELIIHNAPFDVGFLNAELGLLGLQPVNTFSSKITDTLKMAKEMRPGQRNNLDALCRFYNVDNAKRTLHGALLDAELLSEVYLAMTRGQESLMMDLIPERAQNLLADSMTSETIKIRVQKANDEELAAHADYLQKLKHKPAFNW